MTNATTWHGRRGAVLLGPTENRVARWLADMTAHGRITLRTVDLMLATHVERSEAYRITARLRILGLFGVENDRAGTNGGRRYWRTVVHHDGPGLDPVRHRMAWSRITAWAKARRDRVAARLAEIRGDHTRQDDRSGTINLPTPAGAARECPPPAGGTFAESMRRAGLGRLMDQWRVGS